MFIDRGELIIVLPEECFKPADVLVMDPFRLGVNSAKNLTRFFEIKTVYEETLEKIMEMLKRHEAGEIIKDKGKGIIETLFGDPMETMATIAQQQQALN